MKEKSATQQSDIVISPDGTVHISFLWDDLKHLTLGNDSSPRTSAHTWLAPRVSEQFDDGEYQNCQLCPKECGFNRVSSAHPNCGDAKLRVSNSGISFGDEKRIRGEGGSGTIMLSGCPLTCPSCHNPEKVASGKEVNLQDFLGLCQDLLERGAENIQILSPTVHLPSLRRALRILKDSQFPLPIIFKSSGYESVSELKKLKGLVDFYLPDFKFGPCSNWGMRAGVKDYFEKTHLAIQEMLNQVGNSGILIRHVLSPLPEKERRSILAALNSYDNVEISLPNTFVNLE